VQEPLVKSLRIKSPHKIADKKNYKFYLITKTESVVFQQCKIHQTVFQHITVKQNIKQELNNHTLTKGVNLVKKVGPPFSQDSPGTGKLRDELSKQSSIHLLKYHSTNWKV
jgi:hypothetical protein